MLSDAVTVVRKIVGALLAGGAPNQLAAGFALGMLIGLVPKTNLIALSLCVLLFSLRCNVALGLVAAVLFSFVTPWTDPFSHKLGLAALSLEPLKATYASVLDLPLGPWLGFNNTVVTGSLLLGLYVVYPVYWVTRVTAAGLRAVLGRPRPRA